MDDELEEDVCRVCRLEEDEDNPMLHPCKCSGSVRYVHPNCLKSWLATSQKKHCEICGYKYTFQKIYLDYIPSVIPPSVYIRQTIRYGVRAAKYIHRCWIVVVTWLIVLPLANMGGLKSYRFLGDFFLAGFLPSDTAEQLVNTTSIANATLQDIASNATSSILENRTQSEVLELVLISQLGPGVRLAKLAWQAYRQWLTTPRNTTAGSSPQIRSAIFASTFNTPSPYYIFQGQLLSIALAALIISLVFLREWFSSYEWAQHDPKPAEVEEDINPDEWRIRDGQATRIFSSKRTRHRDRKGTRERKRDRGADSGDAGTTGEDGQKEVASIEEAAALLMKLHEDIKKRTEASGDGAGGQVNAGADVTADVTGPEGGPIGMEREAQVINEAVSGGVGMSRYPSAPPEDVSSDLIPTALARSISSPTVARQISSPTPHTGLQLRPPTLNRKKSSLQVASSPSDPLSPASNSTPPDLALTGAEAGPGPSTLAARSSPPTSPAEIRATVEDMAGQHARDFLRAAEAMRQARSRLAEGRTESSTWKAPELLVNKGKGRAVDPQVSTSGEETFELTRNPASPVASRRTSPVNSRHPSVALISNSLYSGEGPVDVAETSTQPREPIDPPAEEVGGQGDAEPVISKVDADPPNSSDAPASDAPAHAVSADVLGEHDRDRTREPGLVGDDGGSHAVINPAPEAGDKPPETPHGTIYHTENDIPATSDSDIAPATEPLPNDQVLEAHDRPLLPQPEIARMTRLAFDDFTAGHILSITDVQARGFTDQEQVVYLLVQRQLADEALHPRPRRVGARAEEADADADGEEEAEDQEADEDEDLDDQEVVFEEDEGEDAGWPADDWDQVLEVVGLIGPYSALLQNLVLAIAIMGAALTSFVLLPMTTGKMFLCIDPIRSAMSTIRYAWTGTRFILHLTRYIVDPVVDVCLEIAKEVVLKPGLEAFWAAEHIIARRLGLEGALVGKTSGLHQVGILQLLEGMSSKSLQSGAPTSLDAPLFLAPYLPEALRTVDRETVLDGLEWLGNKSYKGYEAFRAASVSLATSEKLGDSVLCALIGYISTIAISTVLAWAGEYGYIKVGESWKAGLRRYRLFVKLVLFLALELAAFPLGIGALMMLCTFPLFPHVSIGARLAEMKEIAFGMVFITWIIGTMFMYGFAQILTWARSFCRSGALYFIRDPHDPKYSPVKEMIERSTTSQFHKLGVSSVMYGFLVWWLFGAVPWGMRLLAPKSILPLRLDKYGPLSPIPFDYLFLLLAIPPTLHRIKPQHTLKKLFRVYWDASTHILRLRPLLFVPDTQPPTVGRAESAIFALLDIPFRLLFGSYSSQATLARVPAEDKVVLLRTPDRRTRERMFIPLDAAGRPRTTADKMRLLRQDAATRKAGRYPVVDFVTVHLPQYWRTRIHVFILSLLAASGAALALSLLGPVVLGREMLKGRFGKVHDGYSFLVGAYTIYGMILLGQRTRKLVVSLRRARHRRLASRQTRVKRYILAQLRRGISLVLIYLIHPVLRGLMWEIRLGLIVRYGLGQVTPVLHLWDIWALGAVLNSIELGACGLLRRPRDPDPGAHIIHNLWGHPLQLDLRSLVRILGPELSLILFKTALPFALAGALGNFFRQDDEFRAVHFRLSGMTTWAMYAVCVRARKIATKISSMRQSMIDAEYVVEERVENYVASPKPEPELLLDVKSIPDVVAPLELEDAIVIAEADAEAAETLVGSNGDGGGHLAKVETYRTDTDAGSEGE